MPHHRFVIAIITAALAAAGVQAQNNRTFVSTNGSDSNNCSATAPCRTFNAALAVTNADGELVVLSSGGYGQATVTKPVTISATGVNASITTSGDAVSINTSGNVTIKGLTLYGGGTGSNGIYVYSVAYLRLYNVRAEGFSASGVAFVYGDHLAIYDSEFDDNSGGLFVGQGQVYVRNTGFDHNVGGVGVNPGSSVIIEDSHANGNTFGFEPEGGTLSLIRDEANFNEWGIFANGSGTTIQLSGCTLEQNTVYAYQLQGGATMSGTNPGANVIVGQTAGLPLTAATLQ